MAFFDDLGKVLAGTGSKVVNKTKDLTDITKLSAKVADLQKKNDQLYKTIGKLYMEHYGDNPEDAFKGAVSSIREHQKRITAYKEEIKHIKGIRKCAVCGADIASGTQFCPKCGTKVEDDDIVADVEAVVTEEKTIHPEPEAEETAAEAVEGAAETPEAEEEPSADNAAADEDTPSEEA